MSAAIKALLMLEPLRRRPSFASLLTPEQTAMTLGVSVTELDVMRGGHRPERVRGEPPRGSLLPRRRRSVEVPPERMMTIAPTTAPASKPAAYSIDHDPINDVRVWKLTDRERAIYELGFLVGYAARQPEVDQLDDEAGRLYVAAFDHRHCTCWRQRRHNVTW